MNEDKIKPKAYSYIRFSTIEQAEGTSEERQTQMALDYVGDKYDLIPIRDKGVSGHSGKHIRKGELGKFLERARNNKITPGSRLLIESIDRLTRLKPSDAQKILFDILDNNITLVILDRNKKEITLHDYNNDVGVFYELGGEIQRAYQESKRKSDLISKRRKKEREWARNKKGKISGMPPMWLTYNKDNTDFEVKNEVVKVIQLMFEMKLNNMGSYRIERELNKIEGIYKPKGKRNKSKAWRKSTINRYLKDERLIGYYQPHKYIKNEDGSRKRVKDGTVIKDYYPAVIDLSLFEKVGGILSQNGKKTGNAGGRTGKVSNLLVHIVKCGACGDSMRYIDKGDKRPKLRCDNNTRGLGCEENGTVLYKEIEPLILEFCLGLNVAGVLPEVKKRDIEILETESQILRLEGKYNSKQKLYDKNRKLLRQELNDKLRNDLANDLEIDSQELEDLHDKLKVLRARKRKLNESTIVAEQQLKDVKKLINKLKKEKDNIDLRLLMRGKLQRLINKMRIYFGIHSDSGKKMIDIVIEFTDGVKRYLNMIDGHLVEVETLKQHELTSIDLELERTKVSNRKIKIKQLKK